MVKYAVDEPDPNLPPRPGYPWLAIATGVWALIGLYNAYRLPGEYSVLLYLAYMVGGFGIFVCWVGSVVLAVMRRRVRNVHSLWVPPVVFLIGLAPWELWVAQVRMSRSAPALVAFAETYRDAPEGEAQMVARSISGVRVVAVTRFGSTYVLCLERNPDGESGLVYAPKQEKPVTPAWVRHESSRRINGTWRKYSWSNDP